MLWKSKFKTKFFSLFILSLFCLWSIFSFQCFAVDSSVTFTNLSPVRGWYSSDYSSSSTFSYSAISASNTVITGSHIQTIQGSTATADTKNFTFLMGADFDVNFNPLASSSYDYVIYWKVTGVCHMKVTNLGTGSILDPTLNPISSNLAQVKNGISISYIVGDQTLYASVPSSLQPLGSDLYAVEGYLKLEDTPSLFVLARCALSYTMTSRSLKSYRLQGDFDFLSFTLTPVNQLEYEQWQSSQRIEDGLFSENESQQAVVDGLESSAGAFQGALDDYTDLNDQILRPSEGDIDMDFDSITGGFFDDNFVDQTFGVFYSSPMVITLMLSCISFAILGFIMFGRRT